MKHAMKGWSLFEMLWLLVFTSVNIYVFIAFDDTWIGLGASLTGMMCVVLVAKGHISNYAFGLVNIALYAYIAYQANLYGEVMLNLLFYIPIQFIGFFMWRKHQAQKDNETVVQAKRLSGKQWGVLLPVIALSSALYMWFLHSIGSAQVGVDSLAVVLSIFANLLMVKRYSEQWVIWIVVNVLSIILWLNVFLADGGSLTILVMWSAYLVNSIYGYINWRRLEKNVSPLIAAESEEKVHA